MAFDVYTRIFLALGYSVREMDGTYHKQVQTPTLSLDGLLESERLLAKIALTHEQYDTALAESMAVELDKLKVDYPKHLALLVQSGTLQLRALSNFVDIPLKTNSFTGETYSLDNRKTANPIAIKSYYG